MKRLLALLLSAILVATAFAFTVVANDDVSLEEKLSQALGEKDANSKLDLVIEAPEFYHTGDDIVINVYARNITAANGVHIVEFELNYDNEKLLLVNDIDEDDDNALVCIEKLPKDWENFSSVANDYDPQNPSDTVNPINDGKVTVTVFTAKNSASAAVKNDDELVFGFRFKLLDGACGDLGFVISNESCEAGYNTKTGAEIYSASGDYAIITHKMTTEERMLKLLGAEAKDPKFDVNVVAPEFYVAGEEVTVSVFAENITLSSGLHLVEFELNYDNDKLLLLNDIDEEDENVLLCAPELPKDWENFSSVANDYDSQNPSDTVNPINDGKVTVTVFTAKSTASAAVKDSIRFEFTFLVLEDCEEEIGLAVPHASVEGAYNSKTGADKYNGNGSYAIMEKREPVIVEAEAGVIDEKAELKIDTVSKEDLEGTVIEHIASAVVFDIYIEKDDERIQPNGELKISILAPEGYEEGVLKVYYVSDDGTITDMNAVYADGYYTFFTTHLSYYMIADPADMYTLGDVNDDGAVDKYDYILVKRVVMGTFALGETQTLAADVNQDGSVDKFDYILIKRSVMGTYVIG